jgi:hypothetical protein
MVDVSVITICVLGGFLAGAFSMALGLAIWVDLPDVIRNMRG